MFVPIPIARPPILVSQFNYSTSILLWYVLVKDWDDVPGEVLQAVFRIFDLLPLHHRRDQADQGPVGSLSGQGVSEGAELQLAGIGQDAAPGREPEIGELPGPAFSHECRVLILAMPGFCRVTYAFPACLKTHPLPGKHQPGV